MENPAGSTGATTSSAQATSGLSDQRVELEAALKGLKDGSLSEQEAAAVVERLVDARVDGLRAELSTPATARKIFGRKEKIGPALWRQQSGLGMHRTGMIQTIQTEPTTSTFEYHLCNVDLPLHSTAGMGVRIHS